MNSVNKPIDEAASEGDIMANQMFNAKFEQYFGDNKSASDIKQLLQLVITNNANQSNHIIYVSYRDKTEAQITANKYNAHRTSITREQINVAIRNIEFELKTKKEKNTIYRIYK